MKKLIALALSLFCVVGLAACGSKTDDSTTPSDSTHTHTYSIEWSKDETYHWHAATCEHTSEVKDKAEHVFSDWTVDKAPTETEEGSKHRDCSVCDYQDVQIIAKIGEETFTILWKNWDGAALETDIQKAGELISYDGDTPTRADDDDYSYSFAGWDPNVGYLERVEEDKTFTATYNKTKKTASATYSRDGDSIYFGAYPQRLVEDSSLINELNGKAGTLPSSANTYKWTDYRYYIDGEEASYMYYQDIDYDNDGDFDYRGVYFLVYRPSQATFNDSSYEFYTYQDDNGYETRKVYWFSFDQIEWDVLSEKDGKALIIANLIIDGQEFYPSQSTEQFLHNGGTSYVNNYGLSNIRKWLNDTFYDTAFTALQKNIIATTLVDNSLASTGRNTSDFVCEDTNDKIFLLSRQEAKDLYYSTNDERVARSTDYAKCQGVDNDETYASWWLRSPYLSARAYYIYSSEGAIAGSGWTDAVMGIRPACWITL